MVNREQSGARPGRRFGWVWVGVSLHAFVIASLAVGYIISVATFDEAVNGADIGAGFLAFALGALGFPWSIPGLTGIESNTLSFLAVLAAALVNLTIHAGIIWRLDAPDDEEA